jgi:VanZ family protein
LITWAWIALTVYASTFPFTGWRWPAGAGLWLPWPKFHDRFDAVANLVAYVPLGFLLIWRRDAPATRLALRAVLVAAALSYGLESLQHLLPSRVPSMLDWLMNTAGAALGAATGLLLRRTGLARRIDDARARWFERHGADGLVLLVLWPLALLFPTPVPLGLGQVWDRLRDLFADVLAGWRWGEALLVEIGPGTVAPTPLAPLTELLAVALGLLGPCMAAYCMASGVRRRWWLAGGAATLALGMTTLSTALNFGPQHAMAWSTPTAVGGMALGLLLAWALLGISRRVAAGIGLMAIAASVAIVAQAPADPYFAESLNAWEQGRFIRFHGLAQWIGWCWPYVAIGWLLARIGGRDA